MSEVWESRTEAEARMNRSGDEASGEKMAQLASSRCLSSVWDFGCRAKSALLARKIGFPETELR